jgi:hypothetical protein
MVTREQTSGLQRCLNCRSDLVQPVEWEPAGPDTWSVLLRCPECEVHRLGMFPQPVLDDYDDALARGDEQLRDAYVRLAMENMADDVERLAHALRADAILPEDF